MSGPRRDSSAPPPYVSTNTPAIHRYPVSTGAQKQWGLLTLTSVARSTRSTPLYYEGDSVQGALEVDLADRTSPIKAITVSVSGSVITGPMVGDTATFLRLSTCLWSRKSSAARVGRCTWPFSIPLPRAATIARRGQSATCPLPETFMERHTRVAVVYEVAVTIARGMLRTDTTFKRRFRYVPRTAPPPPSALRQLAYAQNTTLSGPRDDPDGWHTPATVMAHGQVFRTRQAVVQCTFSLASPLSYPRGAAIPCWLVLESGDPHALDAFADPSALNVRLRRRVRWKATPGMHRGAGDAPCALADAASAVWWPAPVHDAAPHTRTLEGEIRLPPTLTASAHMGAAQFSISYTVDLFPPVCVGFTPTGAGPLLSIPVDIVTMHADAPRPLVYAPPAYTCGPLELDRGEEVMRVDLATRMMGTMRIC
ncbi:hypothetical protein B0H15DRAFT_464886 [Mycena belliarum]|uniref:Arrestin-like N-terminal domain-containing protein n=1 Tax=Mycena belliarum TaxID=1033014 RepID=A0AAD6UF19_9AGAR|nr:hypothetical protein B0H15DRAFT_464886 [Mycena belliae]